MVSQINRGLVALVGISRSDTPYELEWLANKMLGLRLFPDEAADSWGWKKSVVEAGGDVLCGEWPACS